MNILLIQGANMEYLGTRQTELYGTTTADELNALLTAAAGEAGLNLDIRYTNIEGEAIGWIYDADRGDTDGLLMNPAGFLYAGHALRDCLKAVTLPYIEIHMTNIEQRDMRSVMAGEAAGMIAGFGIDSYFLALKAMQHIVEP